MSDNLYCDNKNSFIFDVENFKKDGFEKICDVLPLSNGKWFFHNIDKSLMYSDHRSWVYFITINNKIVKCGETGNPLGIPTKRKDTCHMTNGSIVYAVQPKPGSTNRFGRLANQQNSNGRGLDTDTILREQITPYYLKGNSIALWARKCEVHAVKTTILNETVEEFTTIHKNLELAYLNIFKNISGQLPVFNRAHK
jgi:hypothetical protein